MLSLGVGEADAGAACGGVPAAHVALDGGEQLRACVLLLEAKWSRKALELELDFDEYDITANEELLRKSIAVDEGASRFGEVALVPYDSPISNQKILYYNTLFDENASCHVAVGRGYSNCVEGFENMTKAELDEVGVNDSQVHVDFMIGTPDMSIIGWKDGKATPIFADGNWAL